MAMEDDIAEEKTAMLSKHETLDHQTPILRRKGGLRTLPFIILNESFEKVSSYGLLPNMIFYLMNDYHLEAARGSIILSLWSAASNALALVGAFLSDSYLGRFRVIALGTFASLLGTTLLWSTSMISWMKPSPCAQSAQSCDSATPLQFLVLYSSFALISIGAGCVRPCSIAFGADQVDNKENPDNARTLDSFFNWYYASTGLSTILALTLVVYIQDQFGWRVGFGVPATLMVLSLVAFLIGSPLYVHVRAGENLFSSLIKVLLAAYRKRKITLPRPYTDEHYFHGTDSKITTPSDNLRCLNRACVIRDPGTELNPDGSASDSWSLCTVERVENLKAVLRLIPIWSTGIIMLLATDQTYTTLQAKIMNCHVTSGFQIPAGSFNVFLVGTVTIWVAFYDRVMVPLLAKYFGMPRGLGPRVRIGIGLLLSCVAMVTAGTVETVRRKIAIDKGMEDLPDAVLNMSAMWLVPQMVLLGLAEAFNAVGQIEFYYSQLPKSMASIAMAIFTLGMALSSLLGGLLVDLVDTFSSSGGKTSWLSHNLNKGHVDYYYWMLAFIGLVNFLYYLVCSRVYGPSESQNRRHDDLIDDSGYRDLPSA